VIFADDIMAGVGGLSDTGGMMESFASKLARAERFVLDREVIEAAKAGLPTFERLPKR
jgi:hypothetical protein